MRRSSAGAAPGFSQQRRAAAGVHVFHFFRCLPEEEIRTDRRTEDANDHGGGAEIQRQLRPHRSQSHFSPRDLDREQDGGIGQQRKRQPLQEKHVAVIRHKNLKQQRYNDKNSGHEVAIKAADEFGNLSHGSDVRGDVQRVGYQQQQDDAFQHDRRESRLDVGGQSLAGRPPDLRANDLDRRHQRVRERHRPEHVEAKLRPRLRVGGDAARVVIGYAGDKSRTEPCQRMFLQATQNDVKDVGRLKLLSAFLRQVHGPSSSCVARPADHDVRRHRGGVAAIRSVAQALLDIMTDR